MYSQYAKYRRSSLIRLGTEKELKSQNELCFKIIRQDGVNVVSKKKNPFKKNLQYDIVGPR